MKKLSVSLCEKCGSNSIQALGTRYAVYPSGCLVIASLPIAMLHRVSTPNDFECKSCEHKMAVRSTIAKIAYWTLIALLVALGGLILAGFVTLF